jgi:hypothetical protein
VNSCLQHLGMNLFFDAPQAVVHKTKKGIDPFHYF